MMIIDMWRYDIWDMIYDTLYPPWSLNLLTGALKYKKNFTSVGWILPDFSLRPNSIYSKSTIIF